MPSKRKMKILRNLYFAALGALMGYLEVAATEAAPEPYASPSAPFLDLADGAQAVAFDITTDSEVSVWVPAAGFVGLRVLEAPSKVSGVPARYAGVGDSEIELGEVVFGDEVTRGVPVVVIDQGPAHQLVAVEEKGLYTLSVSVVGQEGAQASISGLFVPFQLSEPERRRSDRGSDGDESTIGLSGSTIKNDPWSKDDEEIEIEMDGLVADHEPSRVTRHAALEHYCQQALKDDHGDVTTCATWLRPGQEVVAELRDENGTDQDLFTFNLGRPGASRSLLLELAMASDFPLRLRLMSSAGTNVAFADSVVEEGRYSFPGLPPGIYLLEVASDRGREGAYALRFDVLDSDNKAR